MVTLQQTKFHRKFDVGSRRSQISHVAERQGAVSAVPGEARWGDSSPFFRVAAEWGSGLSHETYGSSISRNGPAVLHTTTKKPPSRIGPHGPLPVTLSPAPSNRQ